MKINISPVDIQLKDLKNYGLIAFLVDRDDFLADIETVRNSIGISNLPYVFSTLPFSEANNIVDNYKKGLFTINEAREALQELCSEKGINLYELDKTLGTALLYAESLLKKYRKSRLYFPVILASILIGEISSYDFSSTRILDVNSENIHHEIETIDSKADVAILLNRESTPKEVEDTFNHIKKYYFGTKKLEPNDNLIQFYKEKIPENKLTDTIPTIKTVRKWYWWNKDQRLGAKKIWNRLGGKKAGLAPKGIEQALRRYRKNLRKPL